MSAENVLRKPASISPFKKAPKALKPFKNRTEQIIQAVFFAIGFVSVACVLVICIYLILAGLPAIFEIGLIPFLFGTEWAPAADPAKFGILPFLLSSVCAAAGALLLGGSVGILCSLYLTRMAGRKTRSILLHLVQILSAIPSVVYGLVGMSVLVPAIARLFHLDDGACLLCAILVLSLMILPSVIALSANALDAVDPSLEEASLALGAAKEETWRKVTLPAAAGGIRAALICGCGRALGEAMAVMMVAGNAANMPSLFSSVRFLTTAVSSEMAYASGLQQQALYSIALVLFLFIMMVNALIGLFKKEKQK